MNIKIFSDGANKAEMIEMNNNPLIEGFTTNPSILRKAGVTNYEEFAKDILSIITEKPVSFEVIADDFETMKKQAIKIASWGKNVFIKIPITNTKNETTKNLINDLNWSGIKINVTAITTIKQVETVLNKIPYGRGMYISIFAGRIADTGVSPIPIVEKAVNMVKGTDIEIIWASTREIINIFQAEEVGCHIITCTQDILKKFPLIGKDLTEYSLDTIKMFNEDVKKAGYKL